MPQRTDRKANRPRPQRSPSREERARRAEQRARAVRVMRARLVAVPIFLVLSVIAGVIVYNTLGESVRGTEPTEQVIAPAPETTSPITQPTTAPTTLPPVTEPSEVVTTPTEPVSEPSPGKQSPPDSVTYALSDGQTVNLTGEVESEAAILIDISEGRVVASRNSAKRIYPASLTKVMTLITAYDYIDDPYNEYFTMTQEILEPLIVSGNSLAGFEVGESSPLIDYYYGLIMPSGADAAEGIAVYCCGSVDAFVDAMNRKASAIGLKNSHFTNPVGEHDEDHYSTVHDMALVLGYAYEIDLLAEVLNTYQYTTGGTAIHPQGIYFESNLQQRMVGDESGTCRVFGGKTGYTPEAGNCVVTYARSNKTGKYYLFASAGGAAMYDPIWDCINTLKDYVE